MADRTAILKLIEQSGNTFHYEVVRFLRENGWMVTVSPYYSDYATDQSREVDIIAERSYPIHRPPLTNLLALSMSGFLSNVSTLMERLLSGLIIKIR